jgi:hypothetical protein
MMLDAELDIDPIEIVALGGDGVTSIVCVGVLPEMDIMTVVVGVADRVWASENDAVSEWVPFDRENGTVPVALWDSDATVHESSLEIENVMEADGRDRDGNVSDGAIVTVGPVWETLTLPSALLGDSEEVSLGVLDPPLRDAVASSLPRVILGNTVMLFEGLGLLEADSDGDLTVGDWFGDREMLGERDDGSDTDNVFESDIVNDGCVTDGSSVGEVVTVDESADIEDVGDTDTVGVPRDTVLDGEWDFEFADNVGVGTVASLVPEGDLVSDDSPPESELDAVTDLDRSFDGDTLPASPLCSVVDTVLEGDAMLALNEVDGESEIDLLMVDVDENGLSDSAGEDEIVIDSGDSDGERLTEGVNVSDKDNETLLDSSVVRAERDRDIVCEVERSDAEMSKELLVVIVPGERVNEFDGLDCVRLTADESDTTLNVTDGRDNDIVLDMDATIVKRDTVKLLLCWVLSVTILRELVLLIDNELLPESDGDPFVTISVSDVLSDAEEENEREGSLDCVQWDAVTDIDIVAGTVGSDAVDEGVSDGDADNVGVTLPSVVDIDSDSVEVDEREVENVWESVKLPETVGEEDGETDTVAECAESDLSDDSVAVGSEIEPERPSKCHPRAAPSGVLWPETSVIDADRVLDRSEAVDDLDCDAVGVADMVPVPDSVELGVALIDNVFSPPDVDDDIDGDAVTVIDALNPASVSESDTETVPVRVGDRRVMDLDGDKDPPLYPVGVTTELLDVDTLTGEFVTSALQEVVMLRDVEKSSDDSDTEPLVVADFEPVDDIVWDPMEWASVCDTLGEVLPASLVKEAVILWLDVTDIDDVPSRLPVHVRDDVGSSWMDFEVVMDARLAVRVADAEVPIVGDIDGVGVLGFVTVGRNVTELDAGAEAFDAVVEALLDNSTEGVNDCVGVKEALKDKLMELE